MSDRFKAKIRQQIEFIERSCNLFDSDRLDEALRIALHVRILFHDTSRSISLVKRLDPQKRLLLLSTCEQLPVAHPGQLVLRVTGTGLTNIQFGGGISPRPCAHLAAANRNELLDFDDWWNEDIWCMGGDYSLTRRQLTLVAANKDGGAHVDEVLPEDYAAFAAAGVGGSTTANDDGTYSVSSHPVDLHTGKVVIGTLGHAESGLSDLHYHSLRQIGYEVLNSPAMNELCR